MESPRTGRDVAFEAGRIVVAVGLIWMGLDRWNDTGLYGRAPAVILVTIGLAAVITTVVLSVMRHKVIRQDTQEPSERAPG